MQYPVYHITQALYHAQRSHKVLVAVFRCLLTLKHGFKSIICVPRKSVSRSSFSCIASLHHLILMYLTSLVARPLISLRPLSLSLHLSRSPSRRFCLSSFDAMPRRYVVALRSSPLGGGRPPFESSWPPAWQTQLCACPSMR